MLNLVRTWCQTGRIEARSRNASGLIGNAFRVHATLAVAWRDRLALAYGAHSFIDTPSLMKPAA
jgi:hypothetical protein